LRRLSNGLRNDSNDSGRLSNNLGKDSNDLGRLSNGLGRLSNDLRRVSNGLRRLSNGLRKDSSSKKLIFWLKCSFFLNLNYKNNGFLIRLNHFFNKKNRGACY